MSNGLNFGQIAIDAADAAELAGFYSQLLDRPIGDGGSSFFSVIPGGSGFPTLMFLRVPDERSGKNRLHVDLVADDPTAHVDRALALGATQVGEFDEYGTKWTTLADPEGNVFDIGLAHQD